MVIDGPPSSDEPTLELIVRGKAGDRAAVEALLERLSTPAAAVVAR